MDIIYEKKEKIAWITFNRPDVFDALNPQGVREFSNALIDFHDIDNLWVGIITRAGENAFAAGVDMKLLTPSLRGIHIPGNNHEQLCEDWNCINQLSLQWMALLLGED
jgi:enoyl-CoA hydratase/carnithine racemase